MIALNQESISQPSGRWVLIRDIADEEIENKDLFSKRNTNKPQWRRKR
jgi:hypothetical protein